MRQGVGQGSLYYLYIDIVFFVNMAMDIVVLWLLRIILKVRTSTFRMILAGAIGALWSCILAVCPLFSPGVQMVLTLVVSGGLMVKVAFRTKGVRELVKGLFGLYLVSAALGGTMTALYQHTRIGYYVEQLIRGKPMEGLPLVILVLLAASAVFGLKYLWITVTEVGRQKSNLYEVTCIQGEKSLNAIGLLDTGNRLFEPVSRKNVHVVSERIWQTMHKEEDPLLLIPFHTVGTEEGMMRGMILDSMVIRKEQEERVIIRPLIAVPPYPVCRDGSYEILLHEEQD